MELETQENGVDDENLQVGAVNKNKNRNKGSKKNKDIQSDDESEEK